MEEIRAGARELGVDLEVGRIPDEDLPQGPVRMTLYGDARRARRSAGDRVEAREEVFDVTDERRRMTREEQVIERLREMGVDAGRIPDEDLPQGPVRMTFFGEVARVLRPGDRVEARVEDGSWRAGYRAISEVVAGTDVPAEQLEAAGVQAEDSVVWITDEGRWQAAPEDERASLPGMPWPVGQLRVAESPE